MGILRGALRVGRHPRILRHTQPHPNTSGVGRFLRKRHVCGAGPLGDRSLPRRSSGDIGVVLWGCTMGLGFSGRLLGWGDIPESFDTLSLTRTPPGLFRRHSRVLPKTQPCPRISGVGRFLRKRHVCGAGPLGDRSLPRKSSGESLPGRCLGERRPRRCSGESRGCTAGLAFSGTLPR